VPGSQGYTAGRFGVELEGATVGFAESVEGGQAIAEVVEEPVGEDKIVHKHIAGLNFEELALTVGVNMSDKFMEWISSLFDRKPARKNGAVSFQDYTGAEKERLSWNGGLITEVGFPALDAASKELGRLTVRISPEETKHDKGSGTKSTSSAQKQQKAWQTSNFRLTIDGVDCSRVSKIDALTITQEIVHDEVGEVRDFQREPGTLEIPNLVVTVSEAHAADFRKWHEDFVIKGKNDDTQEKQGKLEFLSTNLKDVIFTLTFRGLGIFRISRSKSVSGAAAIATLEAHMYCEDMSFAYPKVAAPAPSNGGGAGGGGQPSGTVADSASVLANALRELLVTPQLAADIRRPEHVAARLRATADNGDSTTDLARSSERGRKLGADWAREVARLEELEQVAATRRADWTDLTLGEGHSLVAYLQKAGVVPESHDGPLTLERDPFVEELVDGAAEVYEEVKPHLEEERTPR
jgi:tail tube protein gp19